MTEKKIFIDSNIFINFFNKNFEFFKQAREIFENLGINGQIGIITPYVINELHYFFLKRNGQKIAFEICKDILNMKRISLMDLKLDSSDVLNTVSIANKHNLKTFDAYHAFYCKKLGIKKIATFDEDFKKVPGLKIID